MMDTLFRVEMLGRFSVQQGSREITRFRTQKTGSLLARLALHPSRSHPREVLIEQFWPDSDLKAARTNLSVALNALRQQLEPPGVPAGSVLIADHAQVRLNSIAFTTDVADFEKTLRVAEGETEAAKRLTLWQTAVDLYRGDLMPGYYEDWVLTEQDRLRDAYLVALRSTVKECAGLHQRERAIEYAHRLVQADPFREESHRILMRLLMAVGRPHEALRQYQELERLLKNELQTTPSAPTRELAAQLSHLPPTSRRPLEAAPVGNLPKETTENVRPPTPVTQRPMLKVPLSFTRFFGRAEEIQRLCGWLGGGIEEESHLSPTAPRLSAPPRLITLTGPGGTGKTRLAIEVAGQVKEAFVGGLWFVPLAEVDNPRRIGEVLRDTLELPRQVQPAALDQVIAFLKEQEQPTLLILDNLEQIAGGAAPIVWTLLNRVPLLQCLVTSRHPLALPGEQEVPVAPLPLPWEREAKRGAGEPKRNAEPHLLLTYPSVALFVDRAQTARPDFQITPSNATAIAAICQRVEGIPLAIELAAARVKALTPAQILERLSERFELLASRRTDKGDRHRSLWAAIDWSYHLLSPSVQRFFARLSVFRGGWTLEAAEAICQEEATDHLLSPLDILTQLRGHSLLQTEESSETIRFRMLESLREFAAEQLMPEERAEVERRHVAYFHQWVTGAQLITEERMAWFVRFEEDFDNLRAVFAWSLREGNQVTVGLETASACRNFWWARGHLSEGRQWFASLLERAEDTPTSALSTSLHIAGILADLQGDFQAARPLLERFLEVASVLGNEGVLSAAQEALGNIAYRQGEYEQAHFRFEKSLMHARTHGSPPRVASVLGNLANVAQSSGDFSTSHALNLESLEIWREEGDRHGEGRTLSNLGNLAFSQGQLAEARTYYEQSLEIKRTLVDRFAIIYTLRGIAGVTLVQRDYSTAAAYLRESLALARELKVRMEYIEILHRLILLVRGIGELEVASQMSGAMEAVREEMHYPMPPVDREEYEQTQTALCKSLGTAVYEAARTEGRRLSLEQALTLVEETLASHSL